MISPRQVHPLTDFLRNSRSFVEQLDSDHRPVGLTVNGKVKAVLVDPDTFEAMYDARERELLIAAIRESEAAVAQGKVQPLGDAMRDIKQNLGL